MLFSILLFLAAGAVAGVLAGLLGVGGGIVIVPLLCLIFPYLDVKPDYIQHLALGTSLASIVVTSISSSRSHHRRGAVRWQIVRQITPGILLGTFLGGLVVAQVPTRPLKIFFIVFLYLVATQMLLGLKPKASREMPGLVGTSIAGLLIGLVSSFVGIGGGSLSVPFMSFCNVPMHTAVGTSAAIGFPIAVAGTLGFIVGGWGVPDLPQGALGYVHLLAFAGLACASFCTAPLGAKLSHALPVPLLKRFFAVFLLIIATRMAWTVFA